MNKFYLLCFLFNTLYATAQGTADSVYVQASANKTTVCSFDTIQLTATGGSSLSYPCSYSWKTSGGVLLNDTGQQVQLSVGTIIASDTVIVTITDTANNGAFDTLIITNGNIGISITNNRPALIQGCHSSIDINSKVSGYTLGRDYNWSTGISGAKASISVSAANIVIVTVTNSVGCKDTDSIEVGYQGVTNKVNFRLPSEYNHLIQQWATCQLPFKNISVPCYPPWKAIFDPTGTGSDNIIYTDGTSIMVYTYYPAGTYHAKLTLDSAGCTFTKTRDVVIIPMPKGKWCEQNYYPEEDTTTIIPIMNSSNRINLFPNPTTNELHLSLSDFQPDFASIYDIAGRKVSEMKFEPVMDISALKNGAYLLELRKGNQIARGKFIKGD